MESNTIFKAAVEMLSSLSSITSWFDSFIPWANMAWKWAENTSSPTFKSTSMNSPCSRKRAHFDKRISEWETILKSTKNHWFTVSKPKIAWLYTLWIMVIMRISRELWRVTKVQNESLTTMLTRKIANSETWHCSSRLQTELCRRTNGLRHRCWPQTIFVLADSWHAKPIFYNIVDAFLNLFLSWLTVSEWSVRQDLRLLFS